MSSILKALKKLENEKALRQADSLRIDAEILRSDSPSRLSPFKLGMIAVLLFSCGGAVTYLHVQGVPAEPAAPSSTTIRAGAGKKDLSTQAVPLERIEPDPLIVPAGKGSGAAEIPAPRHSERVSRVKPPGTEHVLTAKAAAAPSPRSPEAKPQSPPEKPPAEIRSAMTGLIPALKVNGIAFQDGIDSVAMINNVPVTKGSLIEGVRVENIYRDRVQFMFGTEKFEISLGRSNR